MPVPLIACSRTYKRYPCKKTNVDFIRPADRMIENIASEYVRCTNQYHSKCCKGTNNFFKIFNNPKRRYFRFQRVFPCI